MCILKYLSITIGFIFAAVLVVAAYVIVPIWSKLPSGSELRHLSETVEMPMGQMPDHVHLALLAAGNSVYLTNGSKALSCIRASFTSDTWGACNTVIPTLALSEIIHNLPGARNHLNHSLRQFIMVVKIEHYLTRKKTLELALNQTYFGSNTFGITQAAHFFFDKDPASLSLSESALLAGLIRAPSRYSPISRPVSALARRDHVLQLMVKYNMIAEAEGTAAMTEPLGLSQ